MYPSSFFSLSLLFVILLLFFSCSEQQRPPHQDLAENRNLDYTATLIFERPDGNSVAEIEIAVAETDAARSEGLMNVHHLPENAGMLFIFEDESPRSFWMANTPIPLDIIFADQSGQIVRIHRNTRPFSHESIQSGYPAMFVVEVNAGYTLRNDINEGMAISFIR